MEKFRSSEVSGGAARGARTASTLVQVVAPSAAAPGRRTLVMRSAAGTTPSLNQGTGREVEVVAGGAHGHHARAVGGRYLHRLFHGRGVRAVRGLPAPGAQGRDAELSPGPCPRPLPYRLRTHDDTLRRGVLLVSATLSRGTRTLVVFG